MRAVKVSFRVLLSLVISGAFIAFSLRHTNVTAVARSILGADGLSLLGYCGVLTAIHLIRVVRWQRLLAPLAKVPFSRVNAATSVGYMLLAILPLRLGELARPIFISEPPRAGGPRVPRSAALASCVVERIVDTLAVGVLAIVSLRILAMHSNAADYARHAATLVTLGLAIVGATLVVAYSSRQRVVALVRAGVRLVSPRQAERVSGIFDKFIGGLHLGSLANVSIVLTLTVVHWTCHVTGFWLLAPAFGMSLTMLQAATVVACQVVGSMIPAGPGMLGTTQFFIQLGLSIFVPGALSVPEVAARAAALANVIWLLQMAQQVAFGVPFVAAGQVSLSTILKPKADGAGPTHLPSVNEHRP
jgi:hypothetical protein